MASHQHQGGLRVLPCRQFGLQLDVQALFTGQQAAAGGRCAVLVDRGLGGIHGFLAAAHARVVIAAEVQHPLAVHQAGVGQRRVMHHKIGVLHPAAHQGLMALREGNGLRRLGEVGDRLHPARGLRLLLFPRPLAQLVFKQGGQPVHGGAQRVLLHRDQHGEQLLDLQRQAQHLQAVAAQVVDEVRLIAEAFGRQLQGLGIHLAHLLADLGRFQALGRGFLVDNGGIFMQGGRAALEVQVAVGHLLILDGFLQRQALHLDAVGGLEALGRRQHAGHAL